MAYNERDFQTALVCGLMSKGRELKGVPTSYLYNGVELPALPDITGEYLTLTHSTGNIYNLSATNIPFTFDGETYSALNSTCQQAGAEEGGLEWTVYELKENADRRSYSAPIWTNYDLTLEDGSILSASDPVPVYK